jgi:hypothetical protein
MAAAAQRAPDIVRSRRWPGCRAAAPCCRVVPGHARGTDWHRLAPRRMRHPDIHHRATLQVACPQSMIQQSPAQQPTPSDSTAPSPHPVISFPRRPSPTRSPNSQKPPHKPLHCWPLAHLAHGCSCHACAGTAQALHTLLQPPPRCWPRPLDGMVRMQQALAAAAARCSHMHPSLKPSRRFCHWQRRLMLKTLEVPVPVLGAAAHYTSRAPQYWMSFKGFAAAQAKARAVHRMPQHLEKQRRCVQQSMHTRQLAPRHRRTRHTGVAAPVVLLI